MRLFHFYRTEDQTGVSGTGPVVEGVQFTNGWCALRWTSDKSSICFYQSLEEVKTIHGHGGKTEILIHDFEPLIKRSSQEGMERFEILMQIIEEASHFTVMADDASHEKARASASIRNLRILVNHLEENIKNNMRKVA